MFTTLSTKVGGFFYWLFERNSPEPWAFHQACNSYCCSSCMLSILERRKQCTAWVLGLSHAESYRKCHCQGHELSCRSGLPFSQIHIAGACLIRTLQALFYAVNVGLGIGYGQMTVTRPGAMWFTVIYCMMGSTFIASAGGLLVSVTLLCYMCVHMACMHVMDMYLFRH